MISAFMERLEKRLSRDELEFLPAAQEVLETPASPAGRTLMLLVCALFLMTLVWSFMGQIDIVATARGRIIASERSKEIAPLEKGIVTAIYVQEGQTVKAGDPLLDLDPTESTSDRDRMASELTAAMLNLERLEQLRDAITTGNSTSFTPTIEQASIEQITNQQSLFTAGLNQYRSDRDGVTAQLSEKRSELAAAEADIKRLSDTLPIVQEKMQRWKDLSDKGITSRVEYLNHEQEYIDTKETLARQIENSKALRHAISGLKERQKNVQAAHEVEIHKEMDEVQTKIASMEQELAKLSKRSEQTHLTSPIDGTVQQLSVSTISGVVTPAEQVMVIVPSGGAIEVEAFVENKDIGFVKEGDEAEVKIDTFKFTKYGLIEGQVVSLSRDAVLQEAQQKGLPPTRPEEQQTLYKARIKLNQNVMRVDGNDVPLSPGMTVTAEIKTGQQRVIEYILSPLLRYRDEAMRER